MKTVFRIGTIFFVLIIFASGCVTKQKTVGPVDTGVSGPPKTLAILPFENNSVTEPEKFAPLSKGLAAMLITDLTRSAGLKVIERNKIQAILKEVALSQSGAVDSATAIKAGQILGAQSIAFGSYMVLGTQVRIDLRIIKTETSETMLAESITGQSADFMQLEQSLAGKIASSLQAAIQPAKVKKGSNIEAALLFSKGLDALDRGDKAVAKSYFAKAVALDPAYKAQVDSVMKD